MPELMDQMFCSQQIVIPPKFPYILKRYCKAAIKTQPYDLLHWSFEYFKALSQHRPPPVKLRLEYPVYSTEGGLTRGCLKVLAQQLAGMTEIPLPVLKAAWGGFCLDYHELRRIMCLCEVFMRAETVPFLHFVAVAGGLLTKTLTHTMILLCESLTKEPDGGSAAIPVDHFLTMYNFLARMDASKDVRYSNGYREGEEVPEVEASIEEEQSEEVHQDADDLSSDDLWLDIEGPVQIQKISLINSHVTNSTKLSLKMTEPTLGKIERSPSMERAGQIERDNYQRERKGRASRSEDVDRKLRELSSLKMSSPDLPKDDVKAKPKEEKTGAKEKDGIEICVYDENDQEIPYTFYGEPTTDQIEEDEEEEEVPALEAEAEQIVVKEIDPNDPCRIAAMVADLFQEREERLEDLERTIDEIAAIVDRYKSTNYDLGMVAGRQMSTTSGEFIVQHIEQQIMAYIDDQIAILPDPDLKRKKAKPEEVEMIRNLLETFIEENMDIIVPEIEEVEEEEVPFAEITIVYAVPGIGGPVDEDIIRDFEQYALEMCKLQTNLFMPRNIRHYVCPPLEKYEEYDYEATKKPKNEEAPTGGSITD